MSVLAKIVERKRADLALRMEAQPLAALERRVESTMKSLAAALRFPGVRFIFECKQASPSEGLLRERFDPKEVADAYRDVADAVSVLTDEPFFQGSFEHLRMVRARVEQPILCKDFIVDPYQVVEARTHGADAVLLMLAVLDDEAYVRCAAAAHALSMECLTEVRDESELARALYLDARIIGINNRDLRTLHVDLGTTARLAPLVPRDRTIVSESGIRSRGDVDALASHVDAFLVGSSVMKEPRIDLAARTLAFGAVKVCGLRSVEATRLAHAAGASLGGLIFAPSSPRFVDDSLAATIASGTALPLVGVFVDDDPARVVSLAHLLRLHAVQLHGAESAEYVRSLRPMLPSGCEVWKAVRVKDHIPFVDDTGADRLLLDAYVRSVPGGTGERFDWSLVRAHPHKSRLVLAGGIDASNVLEAHRVGTGMLDVNSGAESAPGVKDPHKLRALFAALRGP